MWSRRVREKRRKEVKKYVLTVVATCIMCWGKVVLIVGELCPHCKNMMVILTQNVVNSVACVVTHVNDNLMAKDV